MIPLDDIRAFYEAYYEALDDARLQAWPDMFTRDCLYRVIPRENFDRGYTLCTMQAESRGMLQDRVTGLTRAQVYAPRIYRRFWSGLRITEADPAQTRTRQNVLMVQTMIDQPSTIVLCGVSFDTLIRDEGPIRLRERIVVFDSEMLPNSLIYPA